MHLYMYLLKTPAAGHRRPPKHMHLVAEVCDDSWRHQRQEFGKTFCQVLSHIVRKVAFFHPNWSQNGVWAPSGAKMSPGRQKKCPPSSGATHFGGHFCASGASFAMFFLMFFGKAFFSVLGRLLGAQGAQKGAKMSETTPKREAKESSK